MSIKDDIRELANEGASSLKGKIDARVKEMEADDTPHFLIYQVLGVSNSEGQLIDSYQNKGRLLYRAAGTFLEAATKLCFKSKFPQSDSLRIPNTRGKKPKTFEIDCLVNNDAIEIKWRDATTDGDHILKEHTRIRNISDAGYTPIRVMFYYPNREQAIRIQETLAALYNEIKGQYYFGDSAWEYIQQRTGIDLKLILEELVSERTAE